ncbi:hypothetical protein ACTWPT_54185 [Nonomuraea sp. 3N208]|uniref:hypothetical protein n=1 Tax=Nonomuraea sp. 3N208 TaxID=3457421 RepID=UPI003FD44377
MPNDLVVLPVVWRAGYAMANAHPLVLSAIDRRTLANHEDGGGSGPGAPVDRISVETVILLLAASRSLA